jgi:hypothetical protein
VAKYYVESGDLRMIVENQSPVRAAAAALGFAEGIELDAQVTVNERGFIALRPSGQRYVTDLVLETGLLLSLITEHELR